MTRSKLRIRTPQFRREPGAPAPAAPPQDAQAWEDLRKLDRKALRELGLRPWNDPTADDSENAHDAKDSPLKTYVLMLFPGEWYEHIPEGYKIVDIFGVREVFEAGTTDNDIRFGCLPFGILVAP